MPSSRPKGRSEELWSRLEEAKGCLIDNNLPVDDSQLSEAVDTSHGDYSDETLLKVYMLVASNANETKSKNLSVYIGRSAEEGEQRAVAHNNPNMEVLDMRTRPNAGYWEFCMWTSIPTNMRKIYHEKRNASLSKLIQNYWNASHGVSCKVKRGLEIASLFGLTYGVATKFKSIVGQMSSKIIKKKRKSTHKKASKKKNNDEDDTNNDIVDQNKATIENQT